MKSIAEIRDVVTENYWDSKEHCKIIQNEIEDLKGLLREAEERTRVYDKDSKLLWSGDVSEAELKEICIKYGIEI